MKPSFSYWSKRRRVHNNVAENFATVLSSPDSGLVEVGGIDNVTDTGEHDVVPNEPVYTDLQETDRSSDSLQAETIEGELDSEAILESDTVIDGSSGSDAEFSDSDTDLAEKLPDWASTFSIPLTATSGLLGILKPYFPNLPRDARSLLYTPRNVSLQTVEGGEYYHFGILAGIMSQLHSQQCDTMQQCILLQINIDGLPLFKSSNFQFWPILGMVDNMPSKVHSSLAYSVVLKSQPLFQSL